MAKKWTKAKAKSDKASGKKLGKDTEKKPRAERWYEKK